MLLDQFKRMFAFTDWANTQYIEAIASVADPPEETMVLINHIIGAQVVWLSRLDGASFPDDWGVWPKNPIGDCRTRSAASTADWFAYLDGQSDEAIERIVSYKTTKGDPFETSLRDILSHVLNHGTYHRGQIATQLRQVGVTPPSTDFILFARDAGK